MRTQLLQSLIAILLLPFAMVGQSCFDDILPNGGDCNSAIFLCGDVFDGYCGTLPDMPTDTSMGSHPEDLCNNAGDIDNIQWYSFIPCESSIEIDIVPGSCVSNGFPLFGLQTGIYEDCTFGNPLFCYSAPGVSPINIALNDLVPGNIYYLFVDGYAGSICDYKFEVISGIDTSTPEQPEDVNVSIDATQTVICKGDQIKASFAVPDLNIGGFSCGDITGEDLEYVACFEWVVTGTPADASIALADAYDIIGDGNSSCTEIIFYNEGEYQVTTNAEFNPAVFGGMNSCTVADVIFEPITISVEDRVLEVLPQITQCEGTEYTYCDSTYTADAVVQCEVGCTTFIQSIVFTSSSIQDIGTFFICAEDCYEFDGQQYCNAGSIEIEDADNCLTTSFTLIDLSANISYNGDTEIDCENTSITIDPTYTINNNESLNYQWSDENNNPLGNAATLDVTAQGSYTVVITSDDIVSGCLISHTVEITESSELPSLDITPPILTCDDPSGMITVVSDIAVSSSTWSGPGVWTSNDLSPMVSDTGMYQVTVVGVNGCETIEEICVSGDLAIPSLTPDYSDLDCINESVLASYTSDVAIRSQQWDGPGISSDQLEITTSTAGNYTLTVTAFNGCSNTSTFAINDIKDWPAISVGPDMLWNCNTAEVAIVAQIPSTGPYHYQWNVIEGEALDIVDEANVIANTIGEYELVVTNTELGCESRDTLSITENEDVPTAVLGEFEDPLCNYTDNGYIFIESVVGGSAPYSLSINDEPIDASVPLDNLTDGIYNLLVIDNNGCEYIEEITLVKPDEIVLDLPEEIEIKYYATGLLELEYSVDDIDVAEINWYDAQGNLIDQGSTLEFNRTANTTFTAELITIDGCSAMQEISIRVDTSVEIYAPNVFSPNGDGNNDIFWVQGEDEDVMIESLLIYDRWGNKIYEAEDMVVGESSRGWDGKYNGTTVNPGVYVYTLEIRTATDDVIVKSGDVTVVR